MKIGILKTGHVPRRLQDRHPDYDVMFERLLDGNGLVFDSHDVEHGGLPGSAEARDGWLITGSACGVYEDHDWIPPLEVFIRSARDAGVPVVGICFGHQVLAQAMGADVIKHPGGRVMGAIDYTVVTDGSRETLMAFHGDQVMTVPDGAEITHRSERCEIAGLRYAGRDGRSWALGLQPHPEFDAVYEADLIDAYGQSEGAAARDAAKATLDRPLSNARVAGQLADFLKQA